MPSIIKKSIESNPTVYRFRLMQGAKNKEGVFERTRTVGMAYRTEGHSLYTLRLWTFPDARFYLIGSQKTASHYFLMTREPVRSPYSKNRYHWNIVGNGRVDGIAGVVRFQFDLLEQPIYLSLHPEPATSMAASGPVLELIETRGEHVVAA